MNTDRRTYFFATHFSFIPTKPNICRIFVSLIHSKKRHSDYDTERKRLAPRACTRRGPTNDDSRPHCSQRQGHRRRRGGYGNRRRFAKTLRHNAADIRRDRHEILLARCRQHPPGRVCYNNRHTRTGARIELRALWVCHLCRPSRRSALRAQQPWMWALQSARPVLQPPTCVSIRASCSLPDWLPNACNGCPNARTYWPSLSVPLPRIRSSTANPRKPTSDGKDNDLFPG